MAKAMVQVNVRIEPTLYAKVKARAKKDDVTVTTVINAALANAVAPATRDLFKGEEPK